MSRSLISIIFSVIFMITLIAPSVIIVIDNDADISFFYDTTEEEDKGSEKHKDLEVLFSEFNENEAYFVSNETESNLGYYFKKYPKPHLNLISPPPEQHIL
ncbi:MAG: hypothetical protein GXO84_08285 [Chlorobi bacterium]|nr:hypothetical protein [Chlorobiota bacterium]